MIISLKLNTNLEQTQMGVILTTYVRPGSPSSKQESAAEAALKILRPMNAAIELEEKPWLGRKSRDSSKSHKSLRETALDKKVLGKIRIFQLVEHIMRILAFRFDMAFRFDIFLFVFGWSFSS